MYKLNDTAKELHPPNDWTLQDIKNSYFTPKVIKKHILYTMSKENVWKVMRIGQPISFMVWPFPAILQPRSPFEISFEERTIVEMKLKIYWQAVVALAPQKNKSAWQIEQAFYKRPYKYKNSRTTEIFWITTTNLTLCAITRNRKKTSVSLKTSKSEMI